MSGRKVELDEVTEPVLEMPSSADLEDVSEQPSPPEEGANDGDHTAPVKDAIEPRRSTRERTAPDRYDPVMSIMLLDNDEPVSYEEAMISPASDKWLGAMKSEMESMYENQVWTLVNLPNDCKAVENKWILKR